MQPYSRLTPSGILRFQGLLLWWVHPLTSKPGWRGPLAALGALLGSVVVLTLLDELVVQYDAYGGLVWLPVVIVIAGALIVLGWGIWKLRWATRPPRMEAPSIPDLLIPIMVPLYFHFYFLVMLFAASIAARLPALVVISLTMLVVSLVVHGALVVRVLGWSTARTSVATRCVS